MANKKSSAIKAKTFMGLAILSLLMVLGDTGLAGNTADLGRELTFSVDIGNQINKCIIPAQAGIQ